MLNDTQVILIHGAGEDASLWSDVLAILPNANPTPFVAHDLPGHGKRIHETLLASVEDMARDVVDQIDGQAVLVGHSMGGLIALAALNAYSDKVAGIVLVASAPRLPVNAKLLELLDNEFETGMKLICSAATGGRRGEVGEGAEDIARRLSEMMSVYADGVLQSDLRACDRFVPGKASQHARPTIFVLGEKDKMVNVQEISGGRLDGLAEVRTIPGVGHQIPWEAPRHILRAVEDVQHGDSAR